VDSVFPVIGQKFCELFTELGHCALGDYTIGVFATLAVLGGVAFVAAEAVRGWRHESPANKKD
jgi:hypothetical protein